MSAEKWIKWQFLKRNLEEKEFTSAPVIILYIILRFWWKHFEFCV